MKSVHLLVIAAILAVGAVLFLFWNNDPGRAGDRTGRERSATGEPGRTGTDGDVSGAGAGDGRNGADATNLAATLTVLLPDGAPAAGARVEAVGPRAVGAVTDARGRATLKGLTAGHYSVLASADGLTGSRGFLIETARDLGTIQLARVVTIEGTVYSGTGVPLPGARVEAVWSRPRQGLDIATVSKALSSPEEVAGHAISDPDGAYRLRIGAGGSYMLRVNAKGFAQEHEATRTYLAPVAGLDFHLFPGTTLAGTVADAQGRPIADAEVFFLAGLATITGQTPKAEARTNGAGHFSLTVAPVAQMALVTRKPGYATHTMEPKLPATALEIVLERGLTMRLRMVNKKTGEPAPGVTVSVMYRGTFALAESEEDGTVEMANLPARKATGGFARGAQHLYAWGGGYVPHLEPLRKKEPKDGVLNLGDIALELGGILTGRVLDADSGAPIAGAKVRSVGGVNPQLAVFSLGSTLSQADGNYRLTGVSSGAVRVVARHKDYALDFTPMELLMAAQGGSPRAGQGGGQTKLFKKGETTAKKDIRLKAAASVTGFAVGPDGEPVPGARVEVVSTDQFAELFGTNPPPAFSGKDGAFILKGLRGGKDVQLRATHGAFGAAETVTAKAGDPAEVTLKLAEPIQVRGTVRDENGDPVSAAKVTARAPGKPQARKIPGLQNKSKDRARPAVTDGAGAFTLRNVPAGEVVVAIEHQDYQIAEQPLRVRPDQPIEQLEPITLRRGPHFSGIVVDAQGEPIHGIAVYAQSRQVMQGGPRSPTKTGTGRSYHHATTDRAGKFLLAGLRAGSYNVSVVAEGLWSETLAVATDQTDLRVRVVKAGGLKGVVTSNGKPIAGASIAVLKLRREDVLKDKRNPMQNHIGWARSDEDGRFKVDRLPPNIDLVIEISHDDYAKTTVDGVRADGTERAFTMRAGVRLGGIIVGPKGKPVGYATVIVIVTSDGKQTRQTRTKKDGKWSLGGLPAGNLTVVVDATNMGYKRSEPLDIAAGDKSIRVRLERGASIAGTVIGGGKGFLQIVALNADGGFAGRAGVYGGQTRFHLGGLNDGTYTIQVIRGKDVVAEVEGVSTGTSDLEIRVR